jgi:hypothetical protein
MKFLISQFEHLTVTRQTEGSVTLSPAVENFFVFISRFAPSEAAQISNIKSVHADFKQITAEKGKICL